MQKRRMTALFNQRLVFILIIVGIVLSSSFVISQNLEKKSFFVEKNSFLIEKQDIKNILDKGEVEVFVKFKNLNNNQIATEANSLVDKDKIKHYFNDGFSAKINKNDFDKIENNQKVESLSLIKNKHIFLQDSVPIVNGTVTWRLQQNNINLTGIGQTICIIDTGINYTHPDLGGCYGNNNASSSCKILGGFDFVHNDADPEDDNGHGTHVAGIAAANGNITGVAKDAKLAIIKACDSAGSCSDSDIAAGINWCVGNSSRYNISVISMSLGGGSYTSYCDSDPDATIFLNPISSAIAKNISVVVATGNDGYVNAIALPGCIQNVTPVGSTSKNDLNVSSFSNTWNDSSLMLIVAPGENINSTIITSPAGSLGCSSNKKYCQLSGTSMATPHVAGAIALIKQYLSLSSQTKTPQNIELLLNRTGKRVDDHVYSGLNFSRIDIYSSIISLDIQSPNISLISPSNNSVLPIFNQSFICNASDLSLKNMTFYLWNSTGVYNQTYRSISGVSDTMQINISTLTLGNYLWNCLYTDENNNFAFVNSNFSFSTRDPVVNLLSPANSSAASQNQSFICGSNSTVLLRNATFYLSNSTSLENNTIINLSGTNNITTFNYSFTHEDNYLWNCLFTSNNSNKSLATSNFSITYDITKPNITLVEPYPSDQTSSSANEIFYYNLTDNLNIANCSLVVNGNINFTNTSIANKSLTQSFTQDFSPGTYTWNINCSDFGNNLANSSAQSFVITAPAVEQSKSKGGGGGGGGSGGAIIVGSSFSATPAQIESGFVKELNKNDKIKFNLSNETHSLTLNSITDNSVTLTIQSSPLTLILNLGQTTKLNLTSAEFYDLSIKLESINNTKAKIVIQEINEQIPKAEPKNSASQEISSSNTSNASTKNNIIEKNAIYTYLIIFIIIITIIAILFLLIRNLKS